MLVVMLDFLKVQGATGKEVLLPAMSAPYETAEHCLYRRNL